jgi:CubicO group peptidase (beta-lactamase class C family)
VVVKRLPITDPRIRAGLETAIGFGEDGVQVAACLDGDLIVDDWTGSNGRGGTVDGDTLFVMFSQTKAVSVTALHIQAERGFVDYEAPVVRYWPEFAPHGKDKVLVKHVLSYRSGVSAMPAGLTAEQMYDWEWMVRALAEVEPVCPPDTRGTNQRLTIGWLVGEIVRRTDPQHRPFCQFIQDEICGPLGIEDLYMGLPGSEEPRVAELHRSYALLPEGQHQQDPSLPSFLLPLVDFYNQPEVHEQCLPSGCGIWSARAGAQFWSLLARRGLARDQRLLSEDRVRSFSIPRTDAFEVDSSAGFEHLWGVGGYMISGPFPFGETVIGDGPHVLGHGGAGGLIGWADPDIGLSVAITHNRLFPKPGPLPPDEHPFMELADAVRTIAAERASSGKPPLAPVRGPISRGRGTP